jgi:4-hydroxy-2-oxoglutarate aldolase
MGRSVTGASGWLRGVFPPTPTAFDDDGALAPRVLPAFLRHLADCGIDGVVALGSNGEAAMLTERERLDWITSVRSALPSELRLIAGTGGQSTRATIELTRSAAEAGAQAALVITPSYYRRHLTLKAVRQHYEAVAEASPIPVLIYNVPSHTSFDLPPDWVIASSNHPHIAGIKDSSGDILRLAYLRPRLRPDFVILSGTGERMVDAITAGADGGIVALANLAPRECAQIHRALGTGDEASARALQARIAPVGEALTKRLGVPGIKAGLRLQGFDHGWPRPPLPPLTRDQEGELRQLLETAQLLPQAVRGRAEPNP